MKSLLLIAATPVRAVYDDFPEAYFPQTWANESVAILEENMVISGLVYRDFDPMIQQYGDTVNTRKPGELIAMRKTVDDSVEIQPTTAQNIAVVLNQHVYASFMIKDGNQSKAFKDLILEYMQPGALAIARQLDRIVSGQVYQFLQNSGGQLGGLTGDNADAYLLQARMVLNQNNAPIDGRNLILGTVSETALLSNPKFTQAYSVGDQGNAMANAALSRKYGLDLYMAQNMPYVDGSRMDKVTGTVNHTGGYAPGATAITVTGFSAAIANGRWVTFAGDGIPRQITGTTGGATPTILTIGAGLTRSIADTAIVTVGGAGAVDESTGYALGWIKPIVYDSFTNDPQVGQGVSFGTSTTIYSCTQVDTVNKTITLDRPLEASLANNDTINLLPAGSYNLGFLRNAIALVVRPLALPMPGTGARAGVSNYNGVSMRVTMTYDGRQQGTLVTFDMLCGVKVLDVNLGSVLLG